MQKAVFEILTWESKEQSSDADMLHAMQQLSQLVKDLPGFLHQSLYKNAAAQWVCIYFWESEQAAHASNHAVAEEPIFHQLMSLIKAETVTMEVMSVLQHEGSLRFA